ncbi:hypothetical protein LCGC14_1181060 [marine sediment metagenome]|uniref:Uncharacterized protein n=1 Tax=marine sediment metagenome TaxID=412755 RepID=A0A0F9M9U4_9ZZZZ
MLKSCKNCNNKFKPTCNRQLYCLNCRDSIRKENKKNTAKIWKAKNKIRLKKYNKKYKLDNKEKIKNQRHEYAINYLPNYSKIRRKKDINFKIVSYLRTRVWGALKGKAKSQSTMKLIGCNIIFLKQYLEKRFKIGMNWNNYGKWHIDHIKPCCSFDLSKVSEQLKCFNYKNLQPLWAIDNLSKGGMFIKYKEKK